MALAMHAGLGKPCVLAALKDNSLAVLQAPGMESSDCCWAHAVQAGAQLVVATRGWQASGCQDASVGDLLGMDSPQVYAAAGHSVHVMLGSSPVTMHSSTSAGGSIPTGMWSAACTATSPPLPLAVISFLNGTRIMAVHGGCIATS